LKHHSKKVTRVALTALSAAAIALFATPSHALGLGRLAVQSALGDALRAEIDITSLSAEEASSLQIRIASPETYRAAGVEYHPALAGARVSLSRRADGRPYLRLVSDRVVTEPFVDLILELNWASGRLVREYTLLFDPPRTLAQAPAPATAPQVAQAPQPAAAAPSMTAPALAPAASPAVTTPVAPAPAVAPAPLPPAPAADAPPAVAATPAPAPAPVASAPPPASAPRAAEARPPARPARPPAPPRTAAAPASKADEVRVRQGDTLSAIARRVQPDGVSLDQMLVSMYRANPQAFIGDNMNRLRAGAILKVPEAGAAQGIPAAEARSLIVAQSADFNAYRRRLADNVAQAPETPSRQAGGRVQASVDDRKAPATPTPDRLKLSQGAVKASAPEATLSREAAAKDASTRVAELSRNLDDLKKVQQGASAAATASAAAKAGPAAPAATPAVPGPAVTAGKGLPTPPAPATPPAPPAVAKAPDPVPAVASAPAPAPVMAASEPAPQVAAASAAPAPTMAPPASAPPATATAKAPPPPAPAAESPSLIDTILESPYVLPGAAGLAVILAGLGFYRVRQRSKKAASETSFMESRLQPDSFFGQSGGQRVDTSDSAAAAAGAVSSSANYSLSQLDAIGDVDPVAEADVYLAYGRDLQAEEILKEAMRTDPNRLAVRTKLLEVYAKRRDSKGFEVLASQLFTMTRGEGADWQRAQELGRTIDPDNPLYSAGGSPAGGLEDSGFSEPLGTSTMPHSVMPAAPFRDNDPIPPVEVVSPSPAPAPAPAVAQDVDIDLSFDAEPVATEARATTARTVDVDLDIDLPLGDPPAPAPAPASSFSYSGQVDVPVDVALEVPSETEARAMPKADGRLEFDLADISLDLEKPAKASPMRNTADVTDVTEVRPSGFVDLSGLPDDPDSQFNDDGDPLERKLELAEEFRQIGDTEGARDLLNEVIASADGELKKKAQSMLDNLG
jgi:pilus assembly protein FimV